MGLKKEWYACACEMKKKEDKTYSKMTCGCMTCIIYPRVTCVNMVTCIKCIDMWKFYSAKQDKKCMAIHFIFFFFFYEG